MVLRYPWLLLNSSKGVESFLENRSKTAHFVGIGGSGMSGIARVLMEKGYKVTGSDLKMTHLTASLEKMGAIVFQGHSRENISEDVDTVVVSTAISRDNPEIQEARRRGLPVIHRSEMLAELMKEAKGIAVAGAHGKTTITSMIALCLEDAGLDPTVIIGGELRNIGANAKLGTGEYFVAEADESDGSFLKLNPYVAVVSNIEDDHLDYYETVENIAAAFKQYIKNVRPDGFSVLCADDLLLREIAASGEQKIITYGFHTSAEYRVDRITAQGYSTFGEVFKGKNKLGVLELKVPGHHNMVNALAAIAVSCELGIDFQCVARSLNSFMGANRRFQKLGEAKGVVVIDDYAHHPTEIMATLKAARQGNPKRIIAVFQPHRFTRTQRLHSEFAKAFGDADMVIVNDIYSAGENPIAGVDAFNLVEEIKKNSNSNAMLIPHRADTIGFLKKTVKPGDMVLALGAGDVWKVGTGLLEALEGENCQRGF
ncbi:MAG: UDP-N-acetylmuramate--L-alanine ligase [Bacillota bacterium]